MKKQSLLIIAAGAALLLAGCGGETPSTSSNTSNEETSSSETSSITSSVPSTSDSDSSSTTPVVETYLVKITSTTGIAITSNKSKYEQGETVILSVTLSNGYSISSLTYTSSKGTTSLVVNEGQATFVMPGEDVIVKSTLSVEGDIVLEGAVAAAFTKENGIYVARNVTFQSEGAVIIKVAGGTSVGYSELNNKLCFGDITFAYGSTYTKNSILCAGNAIYDFYYDASLGAQSVYIQRVGVISAPKTSVDYASLFDSSVRSDPATYPAGVTGVKFTSNKDNLTYDWKLFSDSSSLATISNNISTAIAKKYVYKAYNKEKNLYTVVDNYIEGAKDANGNYIDDSKAEDTKAFSGQYGVVDTVADGYSKYQLTEIDAKLDVASYSHDVYSLDRNQHYGYRTGFDNTYNNTLKKWNVDVSSVANADGGFTTSISSYKTYLPDTDDTTRKKEHIVYNIETTFTKAGAPLSGTYLETSYDVSSYDFDKFTFLPGGEETGTISKATSFEYSYNAKASGSAVLPNVEKYFATSIETSLYDSSSKQTVTKVDPGTNLSDMLVVTPTPTTALDAWQYGITGSSNTSIVGLKEGYTTVYEAHNEASGDVILTIGNHVTTDVVATLPVTVENSVLIKSFYLDSRYESGVSDHLLTSTSCWVNAGTTFKVGLGVSTNPSNKVGPLNGMSFTYDKEGYLDVSVDTVSRKLVIDSTKAVSKMTEDSITVNVTIETPFYDTEWNSGKKTVIAVTIYKITTDLSAAYMPGTWKVEAPTDPSVGQDKDTLLTFTTEQSDNATRPDYKKATLFVDSDTFTFDYFFDSNLSRIAVAGVKHTAGTTYSYSSYEMMIEPEWSTNKVGIYLLGTSIGAGSEGEMTQSGQYILGGYVEGADEDTPGTYEYVFFDKQA